MRFIVNTIYGIEFVCQCEKLKSTPIGYNLKSPGRLEGFLKLFCGPYRALFQRLSTDRLFEMICKLLSQSIERCSLTNRSIYFGKYIPVLLHL